MHYHAKSPLKKFVVTFMQTFLKISTDLYYIRFLLGNGKWENRIYGVFVLYSYLRMIFSQVRS